MKTQNFGLRKINDDQEKKNDISLGAISILPKLEDIPDEFGIEPLVIYQQGGSDFCAAASTAGASSIQEKIKLFFPWVFAKVREGSVEEWGATLREVGNVMVNYGCPSFDDVSEELRKKYEEQDWDFLRRIENYPDYTEQAKKHKKASYAWIKASNGMDIFDTIRATMWKFQDKEKFPIIGLLWSWGFNYELNTVSDNGFGHAVWVNKSQKDHLIIVGSNGKNAGKDGQHLATREVINKYVSQFGCIIFTDIPKEQAKELNERAEWSQAGYFKKLVILIKRLWL